MQVRKELAVARFNAKQITQRRAVARGLRPALVGFGRLLAEGERHAAAFGHAELLDAHAVNGRADAFDEVDELRIIALAALKRQRPVARAQRVARGLKDLFKAQRVAAHGVVCLADAAVAAVVGADVADLDQPAKEDAVAVHGRRAAKRLLIEAGALRGVGRFQKPQQIVGGELALGEQFVESLRHWALSSWAVALRVGFPKRASSAACASSKAFLASGCSSSARVSTPCRWLIATP